MLEDDLYDEMIVPTNEFKTDFENDRTIGEKPLERYSVYIGNFTWWTTDQDLLDLVAGAGVTDLVDIHIHDNQLNGLSKGYATVTVESTVSVNLMMAKLQNKLLHNKRISVNELILANQQRYENAFKELTLRTKGNSVESSSRELVTNPTPIALQLVQPMAPRVLSIPAPVYMQVGLVGSVPPHPPHHLNYPHAAMNGQRPFISPSVPLPNHPTSIPPLNHPPPVAPLNQPPTSQATPQQKKMLSREEFEEIFNLNRAVVESSMERVGQDARAGMFSEAIETLVTAISLIKESKLGTDPQGLALMKPLQSLLQEVEKDFLNSRNKKDIDERVSHLGSCHEVEERPKDHTTKRNGHHGSYHQWSVSPPACDRKRDRRSPRHSRQERPRTSHSRRSPLSAFSSHHRSPVLRDHHRSERFSETPGRGFGSSVYELERFDDQFERPNSRLGRNHRRK